MRHVRTRIPKRRNPSYITFTPSSAMDVEVFFLLATSWEQRAERDRSRPYNKRVRRGCAV
jgi:hypothetical protein